MDDETDPHGDRGDPHEGRGGHSRAPSRGRVPSIIHEEDIAPPLHVGRSVHSRIPSRAATITREADVRRPPSDMVRVPSPRVFQEYMPTRRMFNSPPRPPTVSPPRPPNIPPSDLFRVSTYAE